MVFHTVSYSVRRPEEHSPKQVDIEQPIWMPPFSD